MQPDAKSQAFPTSLATPSRCQKSVVSARMHKVYLLAWALLSSGSIRRFRHHEPLRLSSPSDGLKGPEKAPPMMKLDRSPLELRVSDQDSLLPKGGLAA